MLKLLDRQIASANKKISRISFLKNLYVDDKAYLGLIQDLQNTYNSSLIYTIQKEVKVKQTLQLINFPKEELDNALQERTKLTKLRDYIKSLTKGM